MFHPKLCVALLAVLILYEGAHAKRTRRIKRPEPEEEDQTPQPSVVSYSTFGFNDVGTYQGFVPSSPDYTKFISGTNPESSLKEQPTVFPTAPESNEYGSNFGSQPYNEQSFSVSGGGGSSPLIQYSQNIFSSPSINTNNDQHRSTSSEEIYSRTAVDVNAPIYGTKLLNNNSNNARNKYRTSSNYNNTDYSEVKNNQNNVKTFGFHNDKTNMGHRPVQYSVSSYDFSNNSNYSISGGDFSKPTASDAQNPNPIKFERVVDFTKFKPHYPTVLDTTRLPPATPIPDLYESNESLENTFLNTYNNYNYNSTFKQPINNVPKYKESISNQFYNDESTERTTFKSNGVKDDSYGLNSYSSGKDNSLYSNSEIDTKKKIKNKPWSSDNNHWVKKWKDPPTKGYEYATNYSSISFKYEADDERMSKPLGSSLDELVPASSNIDFPKYQFPDTDYSRFKKMPEYKVHEDEEDYPSFSTYKDTGKPNQYQYHPYRHLFTTPPTTTSWSDLFKSADFITPLRSYPSSSKYKYIDTASDDVVNIPRRPSKPNYEKPYESSNEWPQYNRNPYKSKPWSDWPKETGTTKFKSEEDLLGLRNQDTSRPTFLPNYQSGNYLSDDDEYRNAVEKWRQSYWKSKYKDSLRDHESYGTENKPVHVPVPKPYPIEVPHPVIVPVPQPYPIQVPIAKPVAVPVIRELKIPIEKPMPYLVYKDVPYPVEKLVPVPVEKEVPVPVVKPYPVHIPHIRPVFHHSKLRDEYETDYRGNDNYQSRPEGGKKYVYKKKRAPNSSRNRTRRPSRTVYQDRNRRRWPERRRPVDRDDELPRLRPIVLHHPTPFKRRDAELTRFEDEPACKTTGQC